MNHSAIRTSIVLAAASAATITASAGSGPLVRTGTSADAAGLQAIVDAYRNDLGDFNAPNPGSVGSGRRQIDWDAAPDAVSAPNAFPGDFFNFNAFPRARGAEFTTPGTGFQLSSNAVSGVPVRFGNITAAYEEAFNTFSAERLFTPLGSNVLDVHFFIPGSDVPATTTGFGVVFTDVDLSDSASIEFYDRWDNLLGRHFAEAGPTEDASLSFVGVSYTDPVVASVRIYSGTHAIDNLLGLEGDPIDLVVMDDFIFGEPIAQVEDCPVDIAEPFGILDLADIVAFTTGFLAQDPIADVNGDGLFDLADITVVVDAYINGCP